MINKTTYIAAWMAIAAVSLLMIATIGILVYPFKLLEFEQEKYPVVTPVVEQGDQVQFVTAFAKTTSRSTTISRQLINNYVYLLPEETGVLPSGTHSHIVTVSIPEYAEPGSYYLRTTYEYEICFLRTVRYVHDTELFEVVERR